MTTVPWIRLYTSWPRHRKTMALRRLIGTAEPILALWCWAAENAPSGDLGEMTADEIEFAAEWRGERGACFSALLAVGYVEVSANGTHALHEWCDGSGAGVSAYMRRTAKQRELMRARRAGVSPTPPSGSGSDQEEEEEVDRHVNVGANVSANKTKKRSAPAVGSPAFEEFWKAFPAHRRVNKPEAIKAWPGDEQAQAIMEHVASTVRKDGGEYIQQADRYLRKEMWKVPVFDKAQQPKQPTLRWPAPQVD